MTLLRHEREDDARRLDHKTLEALRERAVRCVQSGERPTIVARSLGITNRTMFGFVWVGLGGELSPGWLDGRSRSALKSSAFPPDDPSVRLE